MSAVPDFGDIPRREIAAKDVPQIVCHRCARVDEELVFGLKIGELKDEVNRHRNRIHTVDQAAFRRTQIEVEAAVIFRKVWQAVKIVDFLDGQDRQAAGVSGHAR